MNHLADVSALRAKASLPHQLVSNFQPKHRVPLHQPPPGCEPIPLSCSRAAV